MIIVFFHVLILIGKYVCERLNVNKVELSELCEKPVLSNELGCCTKNQNTSTNISNLFDQFYDHNDCDNTIVMKFSPPAYIQRYIAVSNILRSEKYRGRIHKVVDFGCAELAFFNHLKHTPGIHEILCVDVDGKILEANKHKIQPLTADYLHISDHPLKVNIYEGSVIHAAKQLENTDVVICIELIEHLYAQTLINIPKNIFEFIKPQLAIFTTPNAEFNVLFPNLKGFRHDDHKFEWTRREFENWALDIINKYPNYDVKFEGICPGPAGTEKYGCCSQMAIFHRREINNLNEILASDNLFKLIDSVEYPFRVDNRPDDVKILDEASYFIRKYQLNNDTDDETMPLKYLTRVMDNLTISIDAFCKILSNGGYQIIHNKSHGPTLVLPTLSIYSGGTNNSDIQVDDWSHPLNHSEHDEKINGDVDTNNSESNAQIINTNHELINDFGDNAMAIDIKNTGMENNKKLSVVNCYDNSIQMPSHDDTIKHCEHNDTNDYASMCSIYMEPSLNENSLLCPKNITDPNFHYTTCNDDLSTSIINENVVFSSDDEDDYRDNLQLTSTPNKKKSMGEKSPEHCRNYEYNDRNYFNCKIDCLINTNVSEKIYSHEIEVATVQCQETPSTSWSPEIISDSGYPNTYSAPDLTLEYDLPSIAQDSESDCESENFVGELPQNHFHNDEVENGDLANNNRDNEGNNVIAPVEFNELDDIQPFIDVLEIDLENENDIYDFQNGFPVWLLRIHDARF